MIPRGQGGECLRPSARLASIIGPNMVAALIARPDLASVFLVFGLVALTAALIASVRRGNQKPGSGRNLAVTTLRAITAKITSLNTSDDAGMQSA
jgi:hypothetical protein